MNFMLEKKVRMGFAVSGIILGAIAGIVAMFGTIGAFATAYSATSYEELAGGIIGPGIAVEVAAVLGIVGLILQLMVYYGWANALETNYKNTTILLNYLIEKDPDSKDKYMNLKDIELSNVSIYKWAFWLYIVFMLISFFSGQLAGLFGAIAVIFILIYIQNITKVAGKLQRIKWQVYSGYGISYPMDAIVKPRNGFIIFILILVTLGIYGIYLMIKLTSEVNRFIDSDIYARNQLVAKFA